MKGVAYIIVLSLLCLGVLGLFYIVLDKVIEDYTYPWGQTNIIEANMTTYQGYYKIAWDVVPVIAIFGFLAFILVWSQKRELDYGYA